MYIQETFIGAGMRCLSLQMPALIIKATLPLFLFSPTTEGTCCSAPVPDSFIPSTCSGEHGLQTQDRVLWWLGKDHTRFGVTLLNMATTHRG